MKSIHKSGDVISVSGGRFLGYKDEQKHEYTKWHTKVLKTIGKSFKTVDGVTSFQPDDSLTKMDHEWLQGLRESYRFQDMLTNSKARARSIERGVGEMLIRFEVYRGGTIPMLTDDKVWEARTDLRRVLTPLGQKKIVDDGSLKSVWRFWDDDIVKDFVKGASPMNIAMNHAGVREALEKRRRGEELEKGLRSVYNVVSSSPLSKLELGGSVMEARVYRSMRSLLKVSGTQVFLDISIV